MLVLFEIDFYLFIFAIQRNMFIDEIYIGQLPEYLCYILYVTSSSGSGCRKYRKLLSYMYTWYKQNFKIPSCLCS